MSLCIDDEEPPLRSVTIEGTAAQLTSGDPDLLRYQATRPGRRCMAAERAAEYGRRNAVEGKLLVRVAPRKVVAYGEIVR